MSVIFGVWLSRGQIPENDYLLRLAEVTTVYGIDGLGTARQGEVGMGFQAFHTFDRSRLGNQPTSDYLGRMIAFDGRLDNHSAIGELIGAPSETLSDSQLVLNLFDREGEECFRRLTGDWALAMWDARNNALYLARDHAGTRTLFYSNGNDQVVWSTYLETFFVGNKSPELDPEYVAHVISCRSPIDLTPFKAIRSVPPAHFVRIVDGRVTVKPHWSWTSESTIRYRSEGEYDEHFLHVFGQAVKRRIADSAPVLAELSGGMDSTSIVCMADHIAVSSSQPIVRPETVSYYDDTEPNWDERPYFEAVERFRNKKGVHLSCSSRDGVFEPLYVPNRIYPYPGGNRATLESALDLETAVSFGSFRVVLSGIGGDELLGGVPTPLPELANLFHSGKFIKLITRAGEWCATSRQSLLRMLLTTVYYAGDLLFDLGGIETHKPPWLSSTLKAFPIRRRMASISGLELLRARPSAIANGRAWWSIVDSLPSMSPKIVGCYEYRYPLLDKDFVEFMHQIPREEIVGPGRRRLLMRRALRGIVPSEVLDRKRKGYISRGPLARLRANSHRLEELFVHSMSVEYSYVDLHAFLDCLRSEITGEMKWIKPLMSTVALELWLRGLKASGVIPANQQTRVLSTKDLPSHYQANEIRASLAE